MGNCLFNRHGGADGSTDVELVYDSGYVNTLASHTYNKDGIAYVLKTTNVTLSGGAVQIANPRSYYYIYYCPKGSNVTIPAETNEHILMAVELN